MTNNSRVVEMLDKTWQQITLEDQRFYKNKGIYFPSVTYILSYYPKGKQFEQWLRENGNETFNIARDAADAGTKVHRAIENMLEGHEPVWVEENGNINYSLDEWLCILRFADFWNTHKPQLIESEFHIFSNEHIYAGTIDLILKINGELWIVDLKTSKALHTTYELQLASYAVAWNEHFPESPIKNVGILWLKAHTHKPDKSGNKVQGDGWQLKTFDRSYQESFEIFKKVYDIFKIENPSPKPATESYPNKVKLNIV